MRLSVAISKGQDSAAIVLARGIMKETLFVSRHPNDESREADVVRMDVLEQEQTGRRNLAGLEESAREHFGLPDRPLTFWSRIPQKLPWRAPEGSAPSPRLLVSGEG